MPVTGNGTTNAAASGMRATPVWIWVLGTLYGMALIAACIQENLMAPQVQLALQTAIDQEDLIVCSKLGIGQASNQYGECIAALASVRTSYARRNEQYMF